MAKKSYKNYAKLLKKNKIINFDLRKKLTPQQKGVITKKFNELGKFIANDNFIKRHVSNKRIKELKKLGYKTHGNNVWINSEGFNSNQIKIKNNKIQYTGADKQLDVMLIPSENILSQLQAYSNKELLPNETITVRIGENSHFRIRFDNYNNLLNYINRWTPKNPNEKEKLIDQMAIVRFYGEN